MFRPQSLLVDEKVGRVAVIARIGAGAIQVPLGSLYEGDLVFLVGDGVLDVVVDQVARVLLVLEESVQLVTRGVGLLDLRLVEVSLHSGLQLCNLVDRIHLDRVAHLGLRVHEESILLLPFLILQLLRAALQVFQLRLRHLAAHVLRVDDAVIVVTFIRHRVV